MAFCTYLLPQRNTAQESSSMVVVVHSGSGGGGGVWEGATYGGGNYVLLQCRRLP